MIKKSIAQTAKEMFLLGNFEDYDTSTIIDILKTADEQYFNQAQSFLTDMEYDALKRYTNQLEPQHSYFIGVGAEVRGGKVKLPYPMGSLDQVYAGEIIDWVANQNLHEETVIISNKLDGISAMIVYDTSGNLQIAYSRGNGVEGADITRHVKHLPTVPKTEVIPGLVVRGEIIFPVYKFEEIKHFVKSRSGEVYKNPRNAVAGLMNTETIPPAAYPAIHFIAHGIVNSDLDKIQQLDILMSNEFETVATAIWKGEQLTDQTLTDYLNRHRKVSDYEIDGLVIDVDDARVRERMTPTRETLNPGWAVKYKVADASNIAITKVVNVEWNISKHGYLKPKIEIEPVKLAGVTITYATGFNAKFIFVNKVGPGAMVQISRAGDVIPFIEKVVCPAAFAAMPSVDWAWNDTEVDAIMLDKDESEEVKIQQTLNFFRTLNAPLLKEGTVRTMFELGGSYYVSANEAILYMLHYDEEDWVDTVGANGKKIYQGLKQIMSDIPIYMLMGASPFFGRGLGTRKFKQLFKSIAIQNIDDVAIMTLEQIVSAEGFDEKTANKVLNGMNEFIEFYHGITEKTVTFNTVNTVGTMTGQMVVFTGYRNVVLEKLIEAEGGKIGSGVSGKTTIVTAVNPISSQSGKLVKARKLGIKIVSERELKDILGV